MHSSERAVWSVSLAYESGDLNPPLILPGVSCTSGSGCCRWVMTESASMDCSPRGKISASSVAICVWEGLEELTWKGCLLSVCSTNSAIKSDFQSTEKSCEMRHAAKKHLWLGCVCLPRWNAGASAAQLLWSCCEAQKNHNPSTAVTGALLPVCPCVQVLASQKLVYPH